MKDHNNHKRRTTHGLVVRRGIAGRVGVGVNGLRLKGPSGDGDEAHIPS